MHQTTSMSILGFWAQADAVGKSAALLLLTMSVTTWYLIVTKAWQAWRIRRRADRALNAFWSAESLTEAIAHMQLAAPESPFSHTAAAGADAVAHHQRHVGDRLAATLALSEFVTRAIRRAIGRATAEIEAGLTVLASIGSTAPFVGLFGTVWGIYHALIGIGFTGQATIDKVAGPVGEALIMTALGLAVAIPAVLAYNFLVRANRVVLADLDAFAHDLHAYLTTGARLQSPGHADHPGASVASLRTHAAGGV
ncbi:MAG: MotA/TolQ/ExbB proton channel family protein [Betaproteobacteria bacterium]|nr:MotA/TolQ/ExbB proton channel family protein [Betaproteobacteria bacterium]